MTRGEARGEAVFIANDGTRMEPEPASAVNGALLSDDGSAAVGAATAFGRAAVGAATVFAAAGSANEPRGEDAARCGPGWTAVTIR